MRKLRLASRSASRRQAYLSRVAAILGEEFAWGGDVSAAFMRRMSRSDEGFEATLEFICDNPVSANWRLKAKRDAAPWGLRISCYKMSLTLADNAREERINLALAHALGMLSP